jgi:hypothetical protein
MSPVASRGNGMVVGVMVGVVDVLIWKHFVGPSVSDIKTDFQAFDSNIESTERTALLVTSGFTLVCAGFARSAEVFAIGGMVILALDFATKHANAVNPGTGGMADPNMSTSYPMPSYGS